MPCGKSLAATFLQHNSENLIQNQMCNEVSENSHLGANTSLHQNLCFDHEPLALSPAHAASYVTPIKKAARTPQCRFEPGLLRTSLSPPPPLL